MISKIFGILRVVGFACTCALLALGSANAQNTLVATVERPAVMTVDPMGDVNWAPGKQVRIVLGVTEFQPGAADNFIEVVVTAQNESSVPEQKIGMFTFYPYTEFSVDESRAARFLFVLPVEFIRGAPWTIRVYLVPVRGNGEGARVVIGTVELR